MGNSLLFITFGGNIFLIIVSWMLIFMAFWSWGSCISRLLALKLKDSNRHFLKVLLGFFANILFFSIYNLFLPINYIASSIFFIPGIIYFFVNLNKKSFCYLKKINIKSLCLIFFFIGFVAFCAVQKPICADSGLYHFNTIRWANEYATIKGLANLHSRFGFNQLFFIYIASLNFHPFFNDYGYHLANSFLLIFLLLWFYKNSRPASILLIILINFLPMPFFWISAPTPDLGSGLILLFLFSYIVEYFYYRKNSDKNDALSLILIVSCLSVTIKLSNAFFCIGIIMVLIGFSVNKKYSLKENLSLKLTLSFIAVFICIWILRGYILSGYPLFPSTIGKINMKWTVPEYIANYAQQEIYEYARLNKLAYKTPWFKEYVELNKDNFESDLLKNYLWFKYWLNYNFFYDGINSSELETRNYIFEISRIFSSLLCFNSSIHFATQFLLSLAGFIVFLFVREKGYNKLFVYLWISAFVSLLAWFLTAPAIRFTNGLGIILFCSTILLLSDCLKINFENKTIKRAVILFSVLLFLWHFIVYYFAFIYSFEPIRPVSSIPMSVIKTKSGLNILVPANGFKVNDSELPATPFLDENLTLLGNSISDGFAISDNN